MTICIIQTNTFKVKINFNIKFFSQDNRTNPRGNQDHPNTIQHSLGISNTWESHGVKARRHRQAVSNSNLTMESLMFSLLISESPLQHMWPIRCHSVFLCQNLEIKGKDICCQLFYICYHDKRLNTLQVLGLQLSLIKYRYDIFVKGDIQMIMI